MQHNYFREIAELYANENMEQKEKISLINKKEFGAICSYMGDISSSLGLHRGTGDSLLIAAALKAQYEFLVKTMDAPSRAYLDHLESITKDMKLERIEINIEALKNQLGEFGFDVNPPSET